MKQAEAFKPICVVYGKNAYLRRRKLDKTVKRELAGSDPSGSLIRVEGERAEAAAVLDDVRTYSLLGERRVVIVDDADAFVSRNRQALERYAADPADSGCLILSCTVFDARTRLFKAVKKIGELIDCKPLSGQALIQWLIDSAADVHGKKISPQAARCLFDHVGTEQERLDQELSKLVLYVGDRAAITPGDIEALVGRYREQAVFAVTDAIAVGDTATALSAWQQVLATDRAAPGRAIGGLAWGLRRLLEARRRLDQGASLPSLARECWTDVDVFERRMKRCSVHRLEDQLTDLLAADVDSKTGLGNVGTAVEKIIVKQTSQTASA